MLLKFTVKNYKSIRDEMSIDFRKGDVNEHCASLISDVGLPITVLYGPNAGGKSNMLLAMGFLISHITIPIRNYKKGFKKDFITKPLIPYKFDDYSPKQNSYFSIIFSLNSKLVTQYKYDVVFKGETIVKESLYEIQKNNVLELYERNYKSIVIKNKIKGIPNTIKLSDNELFLTTATIFFNDPIINKITEWFSFIYVVDYSRLFSSHTTTEILSLMKKDKTAYGDFIKILNRIFPKISNYDVLESENRNTKVIITNHKLKTGTYSLPFEDESAGTRKIFRVLPALIAVLLLGMPTIVDELDANLHPKLLEFLISLFTNPKINKRGAQLIFTSHDLYTLKKEIFRRDEIWFAAKDITDTSVYYSLVDIKGTDKRVTRNEGSYSKRYIAGKYGADPYFKKMSKL